jgi:hypothetical protein
MTHHYAYPLFQFARPEPGHLVVQLSPLWDLEPTSAPTLVPVNQLHWWHDITVLGEEGKSILEGWSEAQNRVPLCGLPSDGLWTPYEEVSSCPACQVSRLRLEAIVERYRGIAEELLAERRLTIGLQAEVDQLRAKLGQARTDAYPSIHDRILAEDE